MNEAVENKQALDWLSEIASEFGDIRIEVKREIQKLALLWSFFEGTKLDTNASVPKICRYADTIVNKGAHRQLNLGEYLNYVRDRYFRNGNFTNYYYGLRLTNVNREYVEKILAGF